MTGSAPLLLFVAAIVLLPGTGWSETEWSDRDKRILQSLSLIGAEPPPASPSNRVADHEQARLLGARLFFDTRLSGNGQFSCASCHQPERHFTDGLARSKGAGQTMRNAPTVIGSAYFSWFYWDGRRDSLWAQALIPIEAADEMGGSRLAAVRLLGEDEEYRTLYESVFGSFPQTLLTTGLPAHAGPYTTGDSRAKWDRLPRQTQVSINTVYSNLGKAIAAYERTLLPAATRFDRYVESVVTGVKNPDARLSADEIAGIRLFIDEEKTICLQCHNGPMLSNGSFHNTGTGNFEGDHLDFGRIFGLRAVLMDEFNCLGPFSDADPRDCMELNFLNNDAHIPLEGAFKVPGLRNLLQTAPYFHDGRFDNLRDIIEYYLAVPDRLPAGAHEIRPMTLSEREVTQLIRFLELLSQPAP